jgi:DNA replication and repair protein RecF
VTDHALRKAMHLLHLTLSEFRNYHHIDLNLGPGLFLFYGDNAQGKTNLLEAVGMLATGNSFHATSDREVVNWQAPEHIARLEGKVRRRENELDIEMVIFDPTPPAFAPDSVATHSVELPASTPRKRIKINSLPKKVIELIGQMKVVSFAPSDLHLVDGSPDERRRFLDRALCQVQPRYCQALVKYRKIVLQRSALLKRIRDNLEAPGMLDYLDEQLIMLASYLIYERQRMIATLNQFATPLQAAITGGREQLQVIYRPSFTTEANWSTVEAGPHYLEQLHALRKREIAQGVCLLGPHRDDLDFLVNGMNMLIYGSRGQQRTAALATKLAELDFMRSSTGDEPVLLLDDVFSELDHRRRDYLLQQVLRHEQVLLTATELYDFPAEIIGQAQVYEVIEGQLHRVLPHRR